jgi:hypothetical protein
VIVQCGGGGIEEPMARTSWPAWWTEGLGGAKPAEAFVHVQRTTQAGPFTLPSSANPGDWLFNSDTQNGGQMTVMRS